MLPSGDIVLGSALGYSLRHKGPPGKSGSPVDLYHGYATKLFLEVLGNFWDLVLKKVSFHSKSWCFLHSYVVIFARKLSLESRIKSLVEIQD